MKAMLLILVVSIVSVSQANNSEGISTSTKEMAQICDKLVLAGLEYEVLLGDCYIPFVAEKMTEPLPPQTRDCKENGDSETCTSPRPCTSSDHESHPTVIGQLHCFTSCTNNSTGNTYQCTDGAVDVINFD